MSCSRIASVAALGLHELPREARILLIGISVNSLGLGLVLPLLVVSAVGSGVTDQVGDDLGAEPHQG